MKKYLGLFLATLILTSGASAFAYGGGYDGGDKLDRLKDKLSLTDEQVTQVSQIFDANKPDQAQMDAWKAKREKIQSEISAVLTDEQKVKYEEMNKQRDEHKAKREEKKAKYEAFVNSLTPEQKAAFEELHAGFGGKEGFCKKH